MPGGRPLGEASRAILHALTQRPASVPQLAADLQASRKLIYDSLRTLRAGGQVAPVERLCAPGGRHRTIFAAVDQSPPADDRPAWFR